MSSYIEPYDLELDEINFELGIRSMPPVLTRHRMDQLKERLLKEMRGEVEAPNHEFSGNVMNVIKICLRKTKELEALLEIAADQPDRSENILVLISRFNHIKFRINLITSEDPGEVALIKIISERVLCYLQLLNEVREGKSTLKDVLKPEEFLSSDKSRGLSLSVMEGSSENLARALSPVDVTGQGAVPKGYNKNPKKTRTSSPKIDGGEELSSLLEGINLEEDTSFLGGSLDRNKKNKSAKTSARGPMYVPPHERDERQQVNIFTDPAVLSTKPFYQRSIPNYERRQRVSRNERTASADNRNVQQQPSISPQPIYEYQPQYNVPYQPNYAVQQRSNYRNPIPNWHLVYSGDGRGLSVNDFLKQVVFMARADRVREQDLLESAIHLFSGSARSWYMAFEHTFDSWDTLTTSLRQQFISQDGDFGILKDIEQRQQQKDEPFIFYLSAMMNMFDQLQVPLTELSQVRYVLRNMSSFLAEKLALIEIKSLQELSKLCKRIEDVKNRDKIKRSNFPEASNFVNRGRVNEIEHDDRYKLYPVSIPEKSVSFAREVKCVNCRRGGHVYQDCDMDRMRIFCFKCGELGQTSYSCPTCNSGKGNNLRGSAQEFGGSYPRRN